MNINDVKKFSLFAKDKGVSSIKQHRYNELIQNGYQTPYILEERQMNVTQMDVFSRLLMERIIWVAGIIDDDISTIVQAQLMFLDNLDHNDITIHIDTNGGSVKSGLSMIDVMDYIKSDIRTVNTGMAASMGAVLLGAGTKGKRSSLRFSKTMIHQSSGGFSGNIQDAEITMKEWEKYNNILFDLLGEYCNKSPEQVKKDSERDKWLSAEEAVSYGIIDNIITKKH